MQAKAPLRHLDKGCYRSGSLTLHTANNLYAAQFIAAARRDLPNLDSDLARGDSASLLAWLRSHIHSKGRMLRPEALCIEATGEAPTPNYLLQHLESLIPGNA